MIKMKEIKIKTPEELVRLISEKREALRVFRFGTAGAKAKNVKEGMTSRKDIARLMTALKEKKV